MQHVNSAHIHVLELQQPLVKIDDSVDKRRARVLERNAVEHRHECIFVAVDKVAERAVGVVAGSSCIQLRLVPVKHLGGVHVVGELLAQDMGNAVKCVVPERTEVVVAVVGVDAVSELAYTTVEALIERVGLLKRLIAHRGHALRHYVAVVWLKVHSAVNYGVDGVLEHMVELNGELSACLGVVAAETETLRRKVHVLHQRLPGILGLLCGKHLAGAEPHAGILRLGVKKHGKALVGGVVVTAVVA